jgi:hypothetical protein
MLNFRLGCFFSSCLRNFDNSNGISPDVIFIKSAFVCVIWSSFMVDMKILNYLFWNIIIDIGVYGLCGKYTNAYLLGAILGYYFF